MIEGDQETSFDADRIRAAGARAVQVNTGAGCHLDAAMVHRALHDLDPPDDSLLVIENVGNLVCPALFDLGERAKVVVISVTEGDDKPLKYPHMFAAADLVVVNKTDLLPYVDFDVDALAERARSLNPAVEVLSLSARTGERFDEWMSWLVRSGSSRKEPHVEQPSVREASERIEVLLDELAQGAPPAVMGRVEELLQCVLSLYGAGLERVLETVGPGRRSAASPTTSWSGNLLVLDGLHPDDVDTRVQRALDQVRPYLGSHAGGVSLSGVDADGVVHLRLEGSCDGCPSSALTVKSAIEDAILVAAPDVVAVEAEGMVDEEPEAAADRAVPSRRSRRARPADGGGGCTSTSTCRPARWPTCTPASADRWCWWPTCPAPWWPTSTAARCCLQALSRGTLDGVVLTCACGTSYDARLAGRAFWHEGGGALAAAAAAARGGGVEGRRPRRSPVMRSRVTGLGALRRITHQPEAAAGGRAGGALRVLRRRHRRAARPRGRPAGPPAAVRVPAVLPAVRAARLGRRSLPRRRRGGSPRRRPAVDRRAVGRAEDPRRPGLLLPPAGRRRAADVLPRPGRSHRVPARPGRLGQTWPRRTRSLDASRTDVEAVLLRRHDDGLLLLPGADRRLLRAGRRGPARVDRARRRPRGVAADRRVLRRRSTSVPSRRRRSGASAGSA